jgi:predicted DNA repair protein MutK
VVTFIAVLATVGVYGISIDRRMDDAGILSTKKAAYFKRVGGF